MSEYQNEPMEEETARGIPSVEAICAKANALPRGTAPANTSAITAFIDAGDNYLSWMACAFRQDFTGQVIDYGAWPEQGRAYYTKQNCGHMLSEMYPGNTPEAIILAGVRDLAARLLDRQWLQDGGPAMQISLCLVDSSGKNAEAVRTAIRMAARGALLRPSRGYGITANRKDFADYDPAKNRESGDHWWVPKDNNPALTVQYDTNYWKSCLHLRLAAAHVDPGCLSLFGRADEHQLLADHFRAEKPYEKKSLDGQRTVIEWIQDSNKENELFDCAIGCMVAAAMRGCRVLPRATAPKHRRIVYTESVNQGYRPELG